VSLPQRATVKQLAELVDGMERTLSCMEQVMAEAATSNEWWKLKSRMELIARNVEHLADEVQVVALQRRRPKK
jgi:hypothetical protein